MDLELRKQKMLERDLKERGIQDSRVLKAMESVPREQFIASSLYESAYDDGPLPIGYGQTISQPYIVAWMLQELQLKESDKLLEVGTGCGYNAAVASLLVDEVFTIEVVPELAESSGKRLESLGYKNIHVFAGDGYQGHKEQAPYDAIVLTAAPIKVPQTLFNQLGEGGRLIAPEGGQGETQLLNLYIKENGKLSKHGIGMVRFVPMVGNPDS